MYIYYIYIYLNIRRDGILIYSIGIMASTSATFAPNKRTLEKKKFPLVGVNSILKKIRFH